MSPARLSDNYHDHERSRTREIKGPRPSPLKISKDSHIIHKPSSSSFVSSSSISSSSTTLSGVPHRHGMSKLQPHPQPQPQRLPVIIYTHSPKVIHTQARDFMALVQKLTGFSHSDDETAAPQEARRPTKKPIGVGVGNHDDNDDQSLSSVLKEEKRGGTDDLRVSAVMNPSPTNQFLADIPLFTPTSTDNLFWSPRPVLRFPEYSSPNMANLISPPVSEFIKEFPECW